MKQKNHNLITNMNSVAHENLSQFLSKPYQINKDGEGFVIEANRKLPESYFEHLLFPISNFWRSYFLEKLDLIEPIEKNLCIDVCCGTGTLCLNVIPQLGFKKCIAIDNSQVAIDILRGRIKTDEPIEAIKADITKTHFENASVDAVYGNSFLHHLPDNYAFLHEAYRTLKPGGILVFTGEPSIGAELLETAIPKSVGALLRFFRLRKINQTDRNAVLTDIWLYEEQSLNTMLSEVGFTEIKIQGFGILVPLFNVITAVVLGKLTGKSMQPDVYWKWMGWLDKKMFSWVPANKCAHFTVAARKPL